MKPVVYPYNIKSQSAKAIAQAFDCVRVFPDGKFKNNFKRPIINWGYSTLANWMGRWPNQVILNHPKAVAIAANKLLTFQKFKEAGVKHPEWTTSKHDAVRWYVENIPFIARKVLTGKGGDGIIFYKGGVISPIEAMYIENAPLYTKYFKKLHEYRVHVVAGNVIDYVLKKKREGVEANYQIRNSSNGWVFCREGVVLPKEVAEEAVKAVKAIGLDFGAVDVGFNVAKQEACVFEVNTAPGIEGQTIQNYVKAFQEVLK